MDITDWEPRTSKHLECSPAAHARYVCPGSLRFPTLAAVLAATLYLAIEPLSLAIAKAKVLPPQGDVIPLLSAPRIGCLQR